MATPVKLYIYDLSQGMARSMSRQLTGKQIDGIWHTSVVVYDQELYYGQGIMNSVPGTTHHGRPLEMIDMGETFLPLELIVEYVDSLRSTFTAEKYHLLDFNCNTFSNELCQFLCGKSIPSHISDLPSEFLNTPFGQSILPMIENMFGQSRLSTATTAPQQQPPAESLSLLQNVSSAAMSAAPTIPDPVQIANDTTLEEAILTYKAVVVFFTSASCPPCRVIRPDFESLIREKNEGKGQIKILGLILDTSTSMSASMKYDIRATPTFQLFLDGKKYSEFKGANYAELKTQVDILLMEAYPPHPHRKMLLSHIIDQPNVPILYSTPSELDKIYGKLDEFLKEQKVSLDTNNQRALDDSRQFLSDPNGNINVDDWKSLVDHLLDTLPTEKLFPLLDIFRSLLIHQKVSDAYIKDPSQISKILEIECKTKFNKVTWLMVLRIACNIFAKITLSANEFTSNLPISHRGQLTQLLIASLLAGDSRVRQTAASLAYNCSTNVALERLKKEQGGPIGTAEQEDDDWQVELSSAIVDALDKETDEEIIHRLLAAIGKFVFLAPVDTSTVAELLNTLEIKAILNRKKNEKIIVSTKVLGLVRDIEKLLTSPS